MAAGNKVLSYFLKDAELLFKLPISQRHKKYVLNEYPFDAQLLNLSALYLQSRKYYLQLGGIYSPKICSTMRSLSAQDLFKNEIDYTPCLSEMLWFKNHYLEVADPESEITALARFNDISLFHEQNHRVVWQLLPPAPIEQNDVCRYLNFAESLVVTLDLALGDELGKKLSPVFTGMNSIYRPAGSDNYFKKSKKEYRAYLNASMCATYYGLSLINSEDILNAVNYVLPNQKKINKAAVVRASELNEHFTRITNPMWQQLYWKQAAAKLKIINKNSKEEILYLPEDPLDLEAEFFYSNKVFDYYGL